MNNNQPQPSFFLYAKNTALKTSVIWNTLNHVWSVILIKYSFWLNFTKCYLSIFILKRLNPYKLFVRIFNTTINIIRSWSHESVFATPSVLFHSTLSPCLLSTWPISWRMVVLPDPHLPITWTLISLSILSIFSKDTNLFWISLNSFCTSTAFDIWSCS